MAEKPAAAPAPKSSQFPPAMRLYVERAFLAAKTTEQKAAMTPALKAVIDAASAKGELWMTNWDTLPLPNAAALGGGAGAAAAAAGAVNSLRSGAHLPLLLVLLTQPAGVHGAVSWHPSVVLACMQALVPLMGKIR